MALPQTNPSETVTTTSLDYNYTAMKGPVEPPVTDISPESNIDEPWKGGEHCFEGIHDRFCFSCGTSDDVIGCQTCSRCYHSQCMFPPLDASQVPDVWFCPVCVGRNWHTPLGAIQIPPVTTARDAVEPNYLSSTSPPNETEPAASLSSADDQLAKEVESQPVDCTGLNRNPDPKQNDDLEMHNQRWKEAQRWKENAWHAPRGYVLDPDCGERFISLYGKDPLPLSSVIKNRSGLPEAEHESTQLENHGNNRPSLSSSVPEAIPISTRLCRAGKRAQKSPSRKRSKYSDLPKDLEKALELIKSNLEHVSRSKRSQDDGDDKVRAVEQKLRIQEGEVLICRQELQTVKQKLLNEISSADKLRSENAELRQKLQESQALAESKENELRNWQGMLRNMIGNTDGPPTA